MFWTIQHASAGELTLKEEIAMYAMSLADDWGLSQKKILNIIDCESRFNPLAVNPRDIDGYKKYGLLQWHLPTYKALGGTNWRDWKENLDIGNQFIKNTHWLFTVNREFCNHI